MVKIEAVVFSSLTPTKTEKVYSSKEINASLQWIKYQDRSFPSIEDVKENHECIMNMPVYDNHEPKYGNHGKILAMKFSTDPDHTDSMSSTALILNVEIFDDKYKEILQRNRQSTLLRFRCSICYELELEYMDDGGARLKGFSFRELSLTLDPAYPRCVVLKEEFSANKKKCILRGLMHTDSKGKIKLMESTQAQKPQPPNPEPVITNSANTIDEVDEFIRDSWGLDFKTFKEDDVKKYQDLLHRFGRQIVDQNREFNNGRMALEKESIQNIVLANKKLGMGMDEESVRQFRDVFYKIEYRDFMNTMLRITKRFVEQKPQTPPVPETSKYPVANSTKPGRSMTRETAPSDMRMEGPKNNGKTFSAYRLT